MPVFSKKSLFLFQTICLFFSLTISVACSSEKIEDEEDEESIIEDISAEKPAGNGNQSDIESNDIESESADPTTGAAINNPKDNFSNTAGDETGIDPIPAPTKYSISLELSQPLSSLIRMEVDGESIVIAAGEREFVTEKKYKVGQDIQVSFLNQPSMPQPPCDLETSNLVIGIDANSVQINCPAPVQLQLSGGATTLIVDDTAKFDARILYDTDQTILSTSYCLWLSSDPSIITVQSPGEIIGIGRGLANLTVSCEGQTEQLAIWVNDPVLIGLESPKLSKTLLKDKESLVTAFGRYSDGSIRNVNTKLAWTSSNEAIVTVDDGKVYPHEIGSATVTGTFDAFSISFAISVKNLTISELQVTPILSQFKISEQKQFYVTAVYSDASRMDVTQECEWAIENSSVVSVSEAGVAKAIGQGSSSITATFNGVSSEAKINVSNAVITGFTILDIENSMPIGLSKELKAKLSYSDGSELIVDSQAMWSVSDNNIASIVNSVGRTYLLKAQNTGDVTITARYGESTAIALLNIVASPAQTLSILPEALFLSNGKSFPLQATLTFSDGLSFESSKDCVWTVSGSETRIYKNTGHQTIIESNYSGTSTLSRTISANCLGLSKTINLILTPNSAQQLVMNPKIGNIKIGESKRLQAFLIFNDGASVDVSSLATWTSSAKNIIDVSNGDGTEGLITGLVEGSSSIVANFQGLNSSGIFQSNDENSSVIPLGTGLKGEYYSDLALETEKLKGTRVDARILFDWGAGAAPLGVGDYFSIRWSGTLRAKTTENYKIWTRSDDGIRVWINNVLVINQWNLHASRWDSSATIPFIAGQLYEIKVEFYENAGHAVAELYWESPSIVREIIGTDFLYPAK